MQELLLSIKYKILFIILLQSFNGFAQTTISSQINASTDDIEEWYDGTIYTNSTDLELIHDKNTNRLDQTIGLRFNNIAVPQGAIIIDAYIQFTADEVKTEITDLIIQGEATDNAVPFDTIDYNVSGRNTTSASVNWIPSSWDAVGEADFKQRTPNLVSIVDEIVSRVGYTQGNSMAMIITGTGVRVAESYDGIAAFAPKLFITYCLSGQACNSIPNLFVNEAMANNDATIADNNGEYDDWIEIYNPTNTPVNLANAYITDDIQDPTKWHIPNTNPAQTTVPANGYLLLWADDDLSQGANHVNFKLTSTGESIYLYATDGSTLIDQLTFPAIDEDEAYGRKTDGSNQMVTFIQSSPNSSNSNGVAAVARPTLNPAGGAYVSTQTISISTTTSNASIYYTTDGSTPTTSSTAYTGSFTIDSTTTVKAIAVKNGFDNSPIGTGSYIRNPTTELPILHISIDPKYLWSDNEGIYVESTNGSSGPCETNPKNWNQDWEYQANATLYEKDGTMAFNEDCGLSISGGCSRRFDKKSFNVSFKGEYGATKLDYKLFENKEATKWDGFKVRSGSARGTTYRMFEAVLQQVIEGELDVDQQSTRPVALYLNNEYWGLYNIRDRMNAGYVNTHHPKVDGDNLDLIKFPLADTSIWHWIYEDVKEGDNIAYHDLHNFMVTNSLADATNYDYISTQIDINSFLDYFIANIYYNNGDWPGNNLKTWRERSPNGKWRWMMFDLDFLFWNGGASNLSLLDELMNSTDNSFRQRHPAACMPFRRLMEHPDFKAEYIQRTNTYINTVWNPIRVNTIHGEIKNEIGTEIQADFDRWGGWDFTTWDSGFENIYNYFVDRPDYMRQMMDNVLGVSGRFDLTFNVTSNTNGKIVLHDNHFEIPFNYTGKYHKNVKLKIHAIPKPGYRFVKWQETGNTNATLYRSFNTATTLTPVFEAASDIVINEIHYHPNDAINEKEFIEIYNPDSQARDLSKYKFESGICFEFPKGTTIAAGEYLIIAADASQYSGNGYQVFQWQEGGLNNDGEDLILYNSVNEQIDSVDYNDGNSWSLLADGFGSSLELNYPLPNDNILPSDWHSSTPNGGTPGAQNSTTCNTPANAIVINEINYNSDPAIDPSNWVEMYNPNAYAVDLSNWLFCDSDNAYTIPQGTTLAPDSYLVLVEDIVAFSNIFPNLNLNTDYIGGFDFNLSNNGERLSLFDANKCLSDEVIYEDDTPWPIGTDGTGQTLVLKDATLDNALPSSWEVSTNLTTSFIYGSPNQNNLRLYVDVKIFLEGFYESVNNQMHTQLKDNNLLPLSQPYNIAPWNHTGTESVSTLPTGVVDWILVMVRDANANIIEQRAGFINQLGNLIDIDGTQGIALQSGLGNTISLHHRTHLAIVSSSPYSGGVYDFTNSAIPTLGTQQVKYMSGKYVLYAGDYDGNGVINSSDFNDWKGQGAILNQYLPIDGDGNGIINAADYNLWINNRSKIGEQMIRY